MPSDILAGSHRDRHDNPDLRPLALFAAIAVPTGWVFLSTYQILDTAAEPFVLLTLLLGLIVPAIVLMRRDPATNGREVWRDCYRPSWLLVPALGLIPVLTSVVASANGVNESLDGEALAGLLVNVVSSVLIVNLWEELAWTGFFQRRALARWGMAKGSLVAAVLFATIHLPLAWDGANNAGDVLLNVVYLLLAGVGLRLLIAGFDTWSGRSLLTVAVLHASFNAAATVVDPEHDYIRYAVTLVLGLLVLLRPVRHSQPPIASKEYAR